MKCVARYSASITSCGGKYGWVGFESEKTADGRIDAEVGFQEASFAKCLFQIQPIWFVESSWFLASQSSPFSPMTSKIWRENGKSVSKSHPKQIMTAGRLE